MSTRELVEVTQADRDAAADYVRESFVDRPELTKSVRNGKAFPVLSEAFARYRANSTREAAARIEAIQGVVTKYEAGPNHDEEHFYPECQTCLILADLRQALNTGGGGD